MTHHLHKEQSPRHVSFAVIIVSDSRTEATDETGAFLKQRLPATGHSVLSYALLKNDPAAIKKTVEGLLARQDVQVILTSGGTGASHKRAINKANRIRH